MTARAFAQRGTGSASDEELFRALRDREYARLDADNQAYLDFTGSALYARRQIDTHADRLRNSILGNPHSGNGPSLLSTAIIRDAKIRLLDFLDASGTDYVVAFTANTSSAIKLVAESFPFGPDRSLVLAADNHNSMNGVREFARAKRAHVEYVALDDELRMISPARALKAAPRGSLFGFPAQSNFSGLKHPLSLIDTAQRNGHKVLLDAAAFLPTNPLSLKRHPADFVVLSLYKIAGYPAGVGALVARRDSLAGLNRPWFAGGTVQYASVEHRTHSLQAENGEGFEDGTPAFIDIAAVSDALAFVQSIGIEKIQDHVKAHLRTLISGLHSLAHRNGRPLVQIYGPRRNEDRGATLAFNVLASNGVAVPFGRVVDRARNEGVSLRGGCFCNPGASEKAFEFPSIATARCFARLGSEFTVERFAECVGRDIPVGAVRASLGIPTNACDIERALHVIASFAQD